MGHCLIIILRQSSKDLILITVFEKSLVHLKLCSIAEVNINTPYKVFTISCNEWMVPYKKKHVWLVQYGWCNVIYSVTKYSDKPIPDALIQKLYYVSNN